MPSARAVAIARVTPNGAGGVRLSDPLDIQRPSAGLGARAVLVGDLTGEGIEDLIVLWGYSRFRVTPGVVEFYRGLAEGSFEGPQRLDLPPAIAVPAPQLGDFNADGVAELALVGRACDVGCYDELTLVASDASGSLSAALPQLTGTDHAEALVIVDQNDDGIDDLAIGAFAPVILWGSRDNPLGESTTFAMPTTPFDWVSRDGHLVVAGGRIEFYWPFFFYYYDTLLELGPDLQPRWLLPIADGMGGISPALDIDGDGKQDLLQSTTGLRDFTDWFSPRVLWGNETSAPEVGPELGGQPTVIASPDLDGDGTRDLITSDFCSVRQTNARQVNAGVIATHYATVDYWDQPYAWTAVGDFNEDGLDDLLGETFFADTAAIGLARGDGTFEFTPLPAGPYAYFYSEVLDLDGDGHLDLAVRNTQLHVAWGRGDGTFEDPQLINASYPSNRRSYGDIDGDGRADIVEWRYDNDRFVSLYTMTFDGRTAKERGPFATLNRHEWALYLALPDLDGDRRQDLVIGRRLETSPQQMQLHWFHARSDGGFDPAVPFPHEPLVGTSLSLVKDVDLDLDGTGDLIVSVGQEYPTPPTLISLRSDGAQLHNVWSAPTDRLGEWDIRVTDMNGDGRPDLADGFEDPFFWPSYGAHLWLGDGLGGFTQLGKLDWGVTPGPVGRFRRNGGLDFVRIRQVDFRNADLELFPSRGRVKDADEEPPSVEIALTPMLDDSTTPARFEGSWQLTTVPIDDCDAAPRVTRRVIELLPIDAAVRITFRRGGERAIKLFARPGEEFSRDLLLTGPDESEMRALLARGRENGGFDFEHWGRALDLSSTAAPGVERGPTDATARLAQRFVFDAADRLAAVSTTHKTRPLTIAAQARDGRGHVGVTRVDFPSARAAAVAKACSSPQPPELLCR